MVQVAVFTVFCRGCVRIHTFAIPAPLDKKTENVIFICMGFFTDICTT